MESVAFRPEKTSAHHKILPRGSVGLSRSGIIVEIPFFNFLPLERNVMG